MGAITHNITYKKLPFLNLTSPGRKGQPKGQLLNSPPSARNCILLRMQYDLTRALTVSMRTPSATPASAAPGIRLQGSSRRGCLSLVLALEVCALGASRLACMRRRDIWSRLVDTVFHFGGRSGFPFCHHFRPLFLDVIISAPAAYLEHGGLALR